jgi:glycosyltransferase involved in cell wall biosynthesis
MQISVVIPLYNKAPYIQRTLDSVLTQTVQDFEIVVVDDGSTDGGADLVRQYIDPRIRLIKQANAGVSSARNRGIAEAKADLIAFLDADDEWRNNYLEKILELKSCYPEFKIFATSYFLEEANGDLSMPEISGLPVLEQGQKWEGVINNYFQVALKDAPFCTCSMVVEKQALNVVGGFPIGVSRGEDTDTWIRLAMRYSIAFSNTCLVIYHYRHI